MNESLLKHDFKSIFKRFNEEGLDNLFFGEDCLNKSSYALKDLELKNDKMKLGLEIPLVGKPCYDLIGYSKSKYCNADNFVQGYPCGSKTLLNFAYEKLNNTESFIEYDISNNNHVPGVYIIPKNYGDVECLEKILHEQGQEKYIMPVSAMFNNHPKNWIPYYSIYFENRCVDSVRISFILKQENYFENPYIFIEELKAFGFNHLSDTMIEQLIYILDNSKLLEVMFDVNADGSFGPILGFSTFLNLYRMVGWIPSFLLINKFSDERCLKLKQLPFFNFEEIKYEEKTRARLYGARINSVKFRWDNGIVIPAKIYLTLVGGFVD